jgi:hypothetical protein
LSLAISPLPCREIYSIKIHPRSKSTGWNPTERPTLLCRC